MSISDQKQSEIAFLVTRCLDGRREREDVCKLEALLRDDPAAVDFYLQFLQVNLSLCRSRNTRTAAPQDTCNHEFDTELWAALAQTEKNAPAVRTEEPACEPVSGIQRQKIVHSVSKRSLFVIVASAAAILMATVLHLAPPPANHLVGRVSRCVDARWEHTSGPIAEGSDLFTGPVKLTKGLAEVTLDSGATVILEAPVSLELISPSRVFLWKGRIVANIKNSSEDRFLVQTSNSTVVDYGTEFGVEVDASGWTRTYVFQGHVELRAGSDPLKFTESLALKQGDGGRAGLQTVENDRVRSNRFVNADAFDTCVKAAGGSRYHQWLVYKRKLCQDPDLVAYYTFEKDSSQPQVLQNVAVSTEGRLNGDLYSATGGPLPMWTTGRWPEKTALHFSRPDRQVVVVSSDPVLQINGPITIAAWVRCSMPRDGGHIVSCRIPNGTGNYQLGYNSPRDEDEWTGKIQFARINYAAGESATDRIFSNQVFDLSPQWRFVAVTHDNQTVRMYVDGRQIETHEFNLHQEPVEADLVIGADRSAGDPTRFKGEMDELMIFKRVLDSEELAAIYEAGKP